MVIAGICRSKAQPIRLAMHPDTPGPGQYKSWIRESDKPLAVDLFCGAGGLSYGLEAAGYRVALAADTDNWALETHAHNFAGLVLNLDLTDPEIRDGIVGLFDGIDVGLVVGGPPCQAYSIAGQSKIRSLVNQGVRDPNDHRSKLWMAFVDIVERIHPQAILMENVPAIGEAIVNSIVDRLDRCGYNAEAKILDSSDYGVPQRRKRLFVVGVRNGGKFVWPDPAERVNLRDAISDLPVLDPMLKEVGARVLPYDGPISNFQRQARMCCAEEERNLVFDHVTRSVRADDLEIFKLMKPGMLYSELPKHLQRYRSDIFRDKYHRLSWNKPSRTITAHIAKDGYSFIHPEQHRTLTVREAARIQTFPDHFRFAGYRSNQFTQIGNAVPPLVGESVGRAILDATASRSIVTERTLEQV